MFDTKTVVALVGNPNCGKQLFLTNSQAVIMMSATA